MAGPPDQVKVWHLVSQAWQDLHVVVSSDADDLNTGTRKALDTPLQLSVRLEEIVLALDQVAGQRNGCHSFGLCKLDDAAPRSAWTQRFGAGGERLRQPRRSPPEVHVADEQDLGGHGSPLDIALRAQANGAGAREMPGRYNPGLGWRAEEDDDEY